MSNTVDDQAARPESGRASRRCVAMCVQVYERWAFQRARSLAPPRAGYPDSHQRRVSFDITPATCKERV